MTTTAATYSRVRRHAFTQKRARNHNLEEQAQALYKSWFVDFEPFKDGKFVESELGMIPEGWSVKELNEIAVIGKKTINPQKYPSTQFSHYSIPAYDNSEVPEHQTGSDIMSNKFEFSDKSILFSKLNPRIKRIWNVYECMPNSICSTEFVVYSAKDELDYPYLFSIISSDEFYDNIMSKVNGATGSHQRFHPEETLSFRIPYSQPVAVEYHALLTPIIKLINQNKRESANLVLKRDLLLPKLMSGELNVNEIDC